VNYVITALRAPISGRTWREIIYVLASAFMAAVSFVYLIANLAIGTALFITLFGIPVLALVPLGARMFGEGQRRMANSLLEEHIDAPRQFAPRRGFLGWLRSAFGFVDGWRALAYNVVRFPLAMATVWFTIIALGQGVGLFTYPLWRAAFDPHNFDSHGHLHHSGVQLGSFYFDTWPRALLLCAVGFIELLLFPWILRGLVWLDRALMRLLLSGTNLTARVRHLEASRAHAVEDSAATLRRVERDLHDGAQARLVAVAMNLGELKDQLSNDESSDPGRIRTLVDTAHVNAKEAITELRDVVRGIHPPVLDSGLEPALTTLASRSTIPVDVHVQLNRRPGVVIESIAYFCVAELLTNVAKHSGAKRAAVDVSERDGRLRVQVTDDGKGGAGVNGGSGLRGLTNRVETVDGYLVVDSPPGGPTVVSVDLPMRSQE
jgi:signal transduction histidine kinase